MSDQDPTAKLWAEITRPIEPVAAWLARRLAPYERGFARLDRIMWRTLLVATVVACTVFLVAGFNTGHPVRGLVAAVTLSSIPAVIYLIRSVGRR
jgi:nicotinamide riboside transporter PnuC